ncbi:MAG: hypothetical protein DMD87_27660 [Candidatus Rokuibacteriota bacterium]|nr:MAG: hypothetical protein DMD87_27660 [Candidatus Rokubacteria bacterium]
MAAPPTLFALVALRARITFMIARDRGAQPCLRPPASALFPPRRWSEPLTWALYEMGNRRRAADYLLAIQDLQRVSRQVARFFVEYDVWLSPTLAEPPLPLGSFDSTDDNPMQGIFRAAQFVPFTPIFNATGQPAMSVPLHWNRDNVPIGVQFAGRFGDEATLFRLAAQLEQARPWADRWPAL